MLEPKAGKIQGPTLDWNRDSLEQFREWAAAGVPNAAAFAEFHGELDVYVCSTFAFYLGPRSTDDLIRGLSRGFWRWKWTIQEKTGIFDRKVESTIREIAELAVLLVRQYEPGETEAAFAEIKRRFTPMVRGTIFNICGNRDDVDEAVQDVWLKFWTLHVEPANAAMLKGLLRIISVRRAYDIYRRRTTPGPTDPITSAEISTEAERPEPPQSLFARSRSLLQYLFDGAIPPHQALAVAYAEIFGYKAREIDSGLGDTILPNLMTTFLRDYQGVVTLSELREICRPTIEHFDKNLEFVFADINTRNLYGHLLERRCGDTALRDYETKRLALNIAQWRGTVVKALRRRFDV